MKSNPHLQACIAILMSELCRCRLHPTREFSMVNSAMQLLLPPCWLRDLCQCRLDTVAATMGCCCCMFYFSLVQHLGGCIGVCCADPYAFC